MLLVLSGLAISSHVKGGKFAEIYEEFEDCLPFPHLTRLNGRDNLAAHFPDDTGLPPDLRQETPGTVNPNLADPQEFLLV